MSRAAFAIVPLTAALVAVALLAPDAHAHLVQTGFGAFYDGIAHFVVTPADLLVVVALALLAGQSGKPAARALLIVLPVSWLVGAALGVLRPAAGELPVATTLTSLIAGGLVAARAPIGRGAGVAFGAIAGLVHGYGNGATLGAGASGLGGLGVAGVELAVFGVVALVAALAASREIAWQRIALRVAGSWIAAIGLLTLAWMARGRA